MSYDVTFEKYPHLAMQDEPQVGVIQREVILCNNPNLEVLGLVVVRFLSSRFFFFLFLCHFIFWNMTLIRMAVSEVTRVFLEKGLEFLIHTH